MRYIQVSALLLIAFLLLVCCAKNEKNTESSDEQVLEEYENLSDKKKEKAKLLNEIEELKKHKENLSLQISDSFNFIGKWQIYSLVENGQETTLKDNWINIKSDGTFNSYDGELNKNETGKWNFYPGEQRLNIDSDTGEQDDSEWLLISKNDTLIFKAAKSGNRELYLVAKRIE